LTSYAVGGQFMSANAAGLYFIANYDIDNLHIGNRHTDTPTTESMHLSLN